MTAQHNQNIDNLNENLTFRAVTDFLFWTENRKNSEHCYRMMAETNQTTGYEVDLKIPFPTSRHAEIAYNVLRIDAEPKRSAVTKRMTLNDSQILVHFTAPQAKHIRVGVNSFFDALILCTQTLNEFGPPAPSYDFE